MIICIVPVKKKLFLKAAKDVKEQLKKNHCLKLKLLKQIFKDMEF